MENRVNTLTLIKEKEALTKELESLIYGSVELREKGGKKYIYVHFRQDGIATTKYIGEYNDDLYNLILINSDKAKAIKKEIKELDKKLKKSGYLESDLPESVALNIDFAKRHLVDTIYKQAVLEGIATTYADTETIIEGGKINNMTASDVLKVLNLKHAWEFVLNKDVITSPTNFALLCEINKFVEEGFYYNAGCIRSTPVSIGGTNWKPELPFESLIKEELQELLNLNLDTVEKAIEILLFVMKKQIFIDGNKRTAVIFANHLLMSKAKGLIVIPNDKVEEYKKLLIAYYEGKDEKAIKDFLKKFAYVGI
ncbi:MAG: Fic family protein [Clostridia bacterium]|nr:Fic family protein [Clostridia bacterium]